MLCGKRLLIQISVILRAQYNPKQAELHFVILIWLLEWSGAPVPFSLGTFPAVCFTAIVVRCLTHSPSHEHLPPARCYSWLVAIMAVPRLVTDMNKTGDTHLQRQEEEGP